MTGDIVGNIGLGLSVALSFENVLFCLLGVTLGTLAGLIPGIGGLAAVSMLLPLTFGMDPTTGLIMLGGIFYGTAYGGSIAAILLNLPGIPSSAVTCLDGYPMAKQGRGGVALLMASLGSFFGGSVGIILMMLFSPMIVGVALRFGAAEYFALMVMGLVAASTLSTESMAKGLAMVCVGILLGTVGLDLYTGEPRFTFGTLTLMDGLSLVALAMGLFGVSEVISSINEVRSGQTSTKVTLKSMLPTRDDWRRSLMPMVRGSGIGSFFGVLPGAGASLASFLGYAVEKKVARDPSRFGHGAIEGVVSPDTANNAADQTAFIPTLTLGIPGTPTMAIIMGVLIIHGITPGPSFLAERPEMFWGLVMSFWVGNVLLLVLNVPLIGIWVRILTIPYRVLFPSIIVFVCIGAYSVHNSTTDVLMVAFFGAVGFLMRVVRFPPAPLLLGFVLGPMLEENFRRAMVYSNGDMTTFVTHPISFAFLLVTLLIVLISGVMAFRSRSTAKRSIA